MLAIGRMTVMSDHGVVTKTEGLLLFPLGLI